MRKGLALQTQILKNWIRACSYTHEVDKGILFCINADDSPHLAAAVRLQNTLYSRNPKMLAKMADADGNGTISREE